MQTIAISLLLSTVPFAATITIANASDTCPPGTTFIGSGCVYENGQPDSDDVENDTGCAQQEPFVGPAPCSIAGYEFISSLGLYIRPLKADQNERYRPPDGDLADLGLWTGPRDQGWMYEWRKLTGVGDGIHWGEYGYMWLAEPPGGGAGVEVVNPTVVAKDILEGMVFEPVVIGLAPRPLETHPGSIGLVGAPVWMWITNPSPTTWGPIEDSATVGGVTVTVTAQVDHVVWDMGDGATVKCSTPGSEYQIAYEVRDSPTCGHRYQRTSRTQPNTAYQVNATTVWTAEWKASTGATGTLTPPELTSTVHARIGERQVIEIG